MVMFNSYVKLPEGIHTWYPKFNASVPLQRWVFQKMRKITCGDVPVRSSRFFPVYPDLRLGHIETGRPQFLAVEIWVSCDFSLTNQRQMNRDLWCNQGPTHPSWYFRSNETERLTCAGIIPGMEMGMCLQFGRLSGGNHEHGMIMGIYGVILIHPHIIP